MGENDVHISGSGRAFHLEQRKRSSRVFKVQNDEVYHITLAAHLWGIFDWMKAAYGASDYELVVEHSHLVRDNHVTANRNFLENLQFAIEAKLQLHRNELFQQTHGVIPANDDKMHDFSHRNWQDSRHR